MNIFVLLSGLLLFSGVIEVLLMFFWGGIIIGFNNDMNLLEVYCNGFIFVENDWIVVIYEKVKLKDEVGDGVKVIDVIG